MRVCHLCDSSVAGDYFRNITAGLTKCGIEVVLAELGPGAPPSWLTEFPGVKYHSLNAVGKAQMFAARKQLAALVRGERIDILQTHLFYSGLVAALAKPRLGKALFALMRHHTGVVRMLGSRLHVMADRWMTGRADRVITVSEAARAYMRGVDGITRDDIEVIHLGFDFEKFRPDAEKRAALRSELGFAVDDFVVGYVGNYAVGKGHFQLLDALTKIRPDVSNARLLFAGRGTLPGLDDAVAKLPVGSVVFAGWRDDITGVYNAIDVFVQPSLSEAFSQVLVEAMGCGLPVIATDVGGAREVIESGVNGILIDSDDPQAIAREVVGLFIDDARKRSIADAGRLWVRERFSADLMVERHVELYERWMSER
ncbi:MAG: glycosyltransferase family 4 protein [Chloracidobacterium sp.]|nr:glycosyltransferase family 4 protein [Chloracidobacterium sp.]